MLNSLKKIFFFCIILPTCFAQEFSKNIHYQTEVATYLSSSGQTPFWLHSNQYGLVPFESQFLSLRGNAHREYDSTTDNKNKLRKFSYGYGLNTLVNVGKNTKLFLPEAYFKIRYKAFEFYGGRRREIVGLVDSTLTSGSYIWSGNALPIPKIQISIPNYTSIIGHGLISIKGAFSHGWFENQGIVRNYYLHQKWLYGRIGKPNWKTKFYAGFNHQVQWGGRYSVPQVSDNGLITKLPSDFNSYLYVVSGISVNKGDDGSNTGKPLNEQWNRIGNHLGTIDIGFETTIKDISLFVYRQSIYEDGSLFYLNNITDGLLGISVSNNKSNKNSGIQIKRILFEYLNTTSQGGQTGYNNTIPQLRGGDNYFNNGVYLDGWTNQTLSIGTPFFITQQNLPLDSKYLYSFFNTRIQAFILSSSIKVNNIYITTKFSNSHNFGQYRQEINLAQNNLLMSFCRQTHLQAFKFSLGIDTGQLLKNNVGTFLSWTKYY